MSIVLVIDLGMQSWHDLKLALFILVMLALDLRSFGSTLLLALSHFDPFFHCQRLAEPGELVLCITVSLHERTVRDWVQSNVVVRPVNQS